METFKEQNNLINHLSVNMEQAIEAALECHRMTLNSLQHCLSLGGKHSDRKHVNLMKECADICQVSASFMIEGSDFAHDICGVCARICDACANHCAVVDDQDAMMKLCITACRKCAESCRNMEH